MMEEAELEILRNFKPDFACQQMYYYFENYLELFEFIKENAKNIGEF